MYYMAKSISLPKTPCHLEVPISSVSLVEYAIYSHIKLYAPISMLLRFTISSVLEVECEIR